eukprot:NODE_107_length_19843_cov_0.502077.p9 type:complete len:264 gc:universal NODE_107_length_19843_cov_0.502077:8950-9741(+)
MFQILALLENNEVDTAVDLLKDLASSKRSKSIQTEIEFMSVESQASITMLDRDTFYEGVMANKQVQSSQDHVCRSSQSVVEFKDCECGNHVDFMDLAIQSLVSYVDKSESTDVPRFLHNSVQATIIGRDISTNCNCELKDVSCMTEDQNIQQLNSKISDLSEKIDFTKDECSKFDSVAIFHGNHTTAWSKKAKSIRTYLRYLERHVIREPILSANDKELFDSIQENSSIIQKLEIANNSIRNELDQRIQQKPISMIRFQKLPY